MPNILTPVDNFATTTSADMSNSALTFLGSNFTGLGIVTAGVFRLDGGTVNQEYIYFSNISGLTASIPVGGRGILGSSAVAHSAGATVELVVSSPYLSRFQASYLVGHNDAGTHKAGLSLTTPQISSPTYFGTISGLIDPSETWVYVSPNSFKIVGVDVSGKYQKGTFIKLTQTTVKWFQVTSSVFSVDTTITINGGSDYTLANAAITNNFYSHTRPLGFPDEFNYSTTGLTGLTSTTVNFAKFEIRGSSCELSVCIYGLGTGAAMSIPIPVAFRSSYGANMYYRVRVQSNGVDQDGLIEIVPGNSTMTVFSGVAGGTFTNAANAKIYGSRISFSF